MRRREFIVGVGSAMAWPVVARAQQGDRVRRIGVLTGGDENDPVLARISAFTQALADLGWTDAGNARLDLRWHGGDIDRIRALAQELVGLQPDIIVTIGAAATVAVQRETRTIPIVFVGVADAVATGIVPRLNRPGGNVTGFANSEATLGGKWLELLSEIAPGLKRAAIMFTPDVTPVSTYLPSFETAARSLKVVPITAPVRSDIDIETAMTALGREPGGGLVAMSDPFMTVHRAPTMLAAARNNVPAVYSQSTFARDGGLLSYGPDLVDIWRRAASYVDRILRGAKPGDLPVQFPTNYEMIVNLKTAKSLGLSFPRLQTCRSLGRRQLGPRSIFELQLWRTSGRVKSRAVRSTEKQPSANAEGRVKNRKRQQKMRKNPHDGQGYEHQGNEHHSVQYTGGYDPSATGEATE
jgi:putative ABC transport system substrate-binding protein